MPASLPGETLANNLANPSAGPFVIMDPLSGPKGSPFDVKKISGWTGGTPTYANDAANQTPSTGALSTGIGIGANHVIGLTPDLPVTSPNIWAIFRAGFDDDMQPGQRQAYSAPPPPGNTSSNTVDSTRMYIGGGRMIVNPNAATQPGRPFTPSPYTAGVTIVGAGGGSSRDAGTGPAYTGFPIKMVTAAGAVAIGAAIEGTFINRSGVAMTTGQSAFGSNTAALAAPA